MTKHRRRSVHLLVIIALATARNLAAQSPDTTGAHIPSAMDSAFARARALVVSGQTTAGRQIADSIIAATAPNTPAYGNALYGRATLAPTAADAQRDYQRIVVEYPLSAHAGDALLQLAQLERSQGDRAAAIGHLQRFLREDAESPKRGRTGFWLAQLLFEQNDDAQACAMLSDARAAVAAGDVELANQMNFYTTRCDAAVAKAAADSAARADSIRADSTTRADSVAKAAERTRARTPVHKRNPPAASPTEAGSADGRYSVQIGAYGTAADAQQAVDRMHTRGIEARVDGDRKPFRVRIGHYKTAAEAANALAEFKKVGLDGFVTNISGH